MITLLGTIAAIMFIISGGPLALAVYRTPRLVGFSKVGWAALAIALTSVTAQLALLHVPLLLLGATAFNTLVVIYVTVQIFRKSA